MQKQVKIETYIANRNGTVNISKKLPVGRPQLPPSQTKQSTSLRFKPIDKENFQRAANAERISLNEFVERSCQAGVHFSLSEIEFMVENIETFRALFENWDLIEPLLLKLQ